MIRINKYLSSVGICSRRKADEHILSGDVKINGVRAKIGDKVTENDKIEFCGKILNSKSVTIIYVLNKPRGFISTASDEKGRKTVLELVPKDSRVYPIGRLDKESEGLILLTNDGDLAYKLSHPKFEHEREYQITGKYRGQNTIKKLLALLEDGVKTGNKLLKAKSASLITKDGSRIVFNIVLTTGYNRQIRKMCDKIDIGVIKLQRVRYGKLSLNNLSLKLGEYKIVKEKDLI